MVFSLFASKLTIRARPVVQKSKSFCRNFSDRVSVAIVGSGPSGCYTAKYLQASLTKQGLSETQFDVIEKLPTPYGLVRYGVAPDHPEVKNVQNDFDQLFDDKNMNFYGNVNVGQDVSVDELREMYDIVVLAYGCQSDRKLTLPGADLAGVLSAREFVAWYNGHPDFGHIGDIVMKVFGCPTNEEVRDVSVVVIGQGNVALDCARVLAKARPGLFDTDLASRTLPVLGDGVARISVVGRRGHIQGAFTIKELRELIKLEEEGHQTSFSVRLEELEMGMTPASMEELKGPQGRPKSRINKLLQSAALQEPNQNLPKRVNLRFLLNPVDLKPSEKDPSTLGAIVCERTRLEGESGQQSAAGTGEYETIPAQLALVSIGYNGLPLPGLEKWYDDKRGVLRNEYGRIDPATDMLGGLYASGWVKRGPSGIIATNIPDAKETVSTILEDLKKGRGAKKEEKNLAHLLLEKDLKVVDWTGYRNIEKREAESKRSDSQPREKIESLEAQLNVALSNK